MSTNPGTIDFAHAIPPPLNALLLQLSGTVAWLKWSLDVLSWKKGHRVQSWLLVASWWALCIIGPFAIRYALPLFLVLPFILAISPKRSKPSELSTEETFQETITNLLSVQDSLRWPQMTLPSIPIVSLLRVVGVILPPYWFMSYVLGTRVIVASIGTVLLCWKANWATKLTTLMWGSAWFRIGVAYMWSLLSGQPRPTTPLSTFTLTQVRKSNSTELRLLFTIFENQRWWMGLDWTAALLPAERPSWSTSNLQPVSPPTSFTLPEPTTSYIPHPDKPKFRIQRRASWRWEDMEWKVCINKNDAGSPPPSRPQKVQKPLASPSTDSSSPDKEKDTPSYDSTKRLRDRLKEKMGEANAKINTNIAQHEVREEEDSHSQSEDEPISHSQIGTERFTDADGWIYGDNKWENPSDKGGMGKYTRYRRWKRIAVLREESEEVGPGFTGVVRAQPAQTVVSTDTTSPTNSTKETVSPIPSPSEGTSASDRLRQRLQAAMRRDSVSS